LVFVFVLVFVKIRVCVGIRVNDGLRVGTRVFDGCRVCDGGRVFDGCRLGAVEGLTALIHGAIDAFCACVRDCAKRVVLRKNNDTPTTNDSAMIIATMCVFIIISLNYLQLTRRATTASVAKFT
jgi:hypothetical protein